MIGSKNGDGGRYSIGKAFELHNNSIRLFPEIQKEGVYYRVINEDSVYHPINSPMMAPHLIAPTKNTSLQWCMRIDADTRKAYDWRIGDLLTLVCIKPNELYLLRSATEDEIISCAHRDIDVKSGVILPNNTIVFTPSERNVLGLKNGDILQIEVNTKTGNYMRVRKLRNGEKPYPSFKSTKYFNKFNRADVFSDARVKYSVIYTSRLSIPRIFSARNALNPGDKCTVLKFENELLVGVPQVCDVCGQKYDGFTKMEKIHICDNCDEYLPIAQNKIRETGSVDAARIDVQQYLKEEITQIEQTIGKILNNIF